MVVFGAIFAGIFVAPISADSRCNGGYGVTLYTDINYHGTPITFCRAQLPTGGPHVPKLGPYGWNDRASSYQVFNAQSSQCIRFYEHENYLGTTITTCGADNIPDLRNFYPSRFDGWNDVMSSLQTLF